MTAAPPSGPRDDARTARRAVLIVVLLVPVLFVLVPAARYLWWYASQVSRSGPDDWGWQQNADSGDLTAWQSRAEANQILRDTAAATGLDVRLLYPGGVGGESCTRSDGKDGISYSLDGLIHDGPVDSAAVIAAVVAYWQHLGLKIDAPRTLGPTSTTPVTKAWAITSTGASLEVGSDPTNVTLFSGESGCAKSGGGPTPLPSATLLPVSSGVPLPGSATP